MAETDKLTDNLEILLREKKYLNALDLARRCEENRKSSSARISGKLLLSLSQTYYFNNFYQKSKEYLKLYEKRHPGSCQGKVYIRHKYRILILEERTEQAIEFIRNQLKQNVTESERYWLFLYLGKAHFWNGDYLDANRCFQKCYSYFLVSNDNYMLGHTLYMMGYLAFQRSVIKDSENYFQEALKYFRTSNTIHQAGHCLKMLSVIKYRTGRYFEARKDLQLAKRAYQTLNSRSNVINCRIVLVRILMFQGEYDACEQILKETYREADKLNHKRAQALSAEFLGEVYYRRNQYEEAEDWLSKALKLARESAPRGDVAVEVYRRLADVEIALGQFDNAKDMISKAYELCKHLGDKYELGSVYRADAILALRKGDLERARSLFEESVITHKSINEKFELASTCKTAAGEYLDWSGREDIARGMKEKLIEEARSLAMEAMKIFSSIKLEVRARKCRELFRRIKEESGETGYIKVVFDPYWLYGDCLVARSSHMKKIVRRVKDLAAQDVEVFLEGETGTGKEVVAKLLHRWSNRSDKPFIAVNCASVADELFESEFFGHVRGAYSGAVRSREGYIESAGEGTLFLDEISELKRNQQAKLLRVLQEGKLRRVGETREIDVNIRLISASNERIEDLLESGRLREDFYYRVCSEVIELNPLRERVEDIPELFAYYLNVLSGELIAERDLIENLKNYSWPGNVRELIKVTRALSNKAGESGILRVDYLPARIRNGKAAGATGSGDSKEAGVVSEDKKALIKKTLRKCNGNKAAAARELGISRSTLYRWLEELKS